MVFQSKKLEAEVLRMQRELTTAALQDGDEELQVRVASTRNPNHVHVVQLITILSADGSYIFMYMY